MTKELKEKILAFNRNVKVRKEKASDLDILVGALLKLPPGQVKKLLTPDIVAVMEKYGYEGGE